MLTTFFRAVLLKPEIELNNSVRTSVSGIPTAVNGRRGVAGGVEV